MSTLQDAGFWARFWTRVSGRTYQHKGERSYSDDTSSTLSGSVVNHSTALKLSSVMACVRLRSETIASLPLHLYDDKKEVASDHPLYAILHDKPNANMSAIEYWQAVIANKDLRGNSYSLIVRSGNRVISLEPLDVDGMVVERMKDGSLRYEYTTNGVKEVFSEDEIFHFKGFSLDGIRGLSTIAYAADTLGFQIDANKTAQNEFKNGLKAGGFLKTGERTLDDVQRTRLKLSMAEFSRPENTGKNMVLEAGMDYVAANRINPQDAQLLESRYFGIEEICRAFNVPPQLIGHTDKASSWASSLEQTNMAFLTYSLRPDLVRLEQLIARKLLTPTERLKYKPRFSVEGLLRADSQARSQFYTTMLQNGVMSRNNVRELEDLPRVDGGDDLTIQLNMTTIDKIGEQSE